MADDSKEGRELVSLHHPDDVKNPLDHARLAEQLSRNAIAAVNADRKRRGLGPLPKE